MSAPASPWASRLHTVAQRIESQGLDALVVSAAPNITYLAGFTASAGLLVCGRSETWLVADGRYQAMARSRIAEGQMASVRVEAAEPRYDVALTRLLQDRGLVDVGFEATHVAVATLSHWQRLASAIQWRPTEGLVERLRVVKDAAEQDRLREAGRTLAGVARTLDRWVAGGRTERDIAADIDRALIHAGFSAPAFPTIVASGPNSALPHARPTRRVLQTGDLVVLDFGGVLDGYCVDLTRMAVVGQAAPQAERLYVAVRDAQAAAIAAVRAGIAGSEVDRAARQVLDSRGLAAAFVHGTGHGLGLEVHEAPRITRADSGGGDMLEAGMACTIEPGAYVEGLGGVRLEDDVIVTTGGCEILTEAPRDLLVV